MCVRKSQSHSNVSFVTLKKKKKILYGIVMSTVSVPHVGDFQQCLSCYLPYMESECGDRA